MSSHKQKTRSSVTCNRLSCVQRNVHLLKDCARRLRFKYS